MTDAEKLELPKGAPVEDPGAHELGMMAPIFGQSTTLANML